MALDNANNMYLFGVKFEKTAKGHYWKRKNYLPVIWPGACSKHFHNTNENSSCFNETFECLVDNLSGQNFYYGKHIRENHDVKGHIDFHITKSGVCHKRSKIWFESFSSNSIPGGRNRLLRHDSVPSFTKDEKEHFAMPRSSKPIRGHVKVNNPADRSFFQQQ